MPGVLTCRHREKGLLEGGLDGLDPRIVAYITDAGLDWAALGPTYGH